MSADSITRHFSTESGHECKYYQCRGAGMTGCCVNVDVWGKPNLHLLSKLVSVADAIKCHVGCCVSVFKEHRWFDFSHIFDLLFNCYSSVATVSNLLFSLIHHLFHYYDSSLTQNA